jgi:hypothetical protein
LELTEFHISKHTTPLWTTQTAEIVASDGEDVTGTLVIASTTIPTVCLSSTPHGESSITSERLIVGLMWGDGEECCFQTKLPGF